MDLIDKYFTELSEEQRERFAALYDLYADWNSKINVVSRKDFDQLYLRHVLHSLAITKVCQFADGARVMDVGTGGGFPGIPLAIMFPNADFTLVDSIGKKITVVKGVSEALELKNVTALNTRAESVRGKFDYVVSRAVTEMAPFVGWVWNKIEKGKKGTLANGIIYLKGGDLAEELAKAGKRCNIYEIGSFFEEDFFETKRVIHLPK